MVLLCSKTLSQYLLGITDKSCQNFQREKLVPRQRLEIDRPSVAAEVTCSVGNVYRRQLIFILMIPFIICNA
jgi:hypothetical protein